MRTKTKHIVLVVVMALFLFGFPIWGILTPDGIQSVSERRPLAEFPKLNQETITNGSFMIEFENYTLDQFPLRDQFRTLKSLTSLYIFRKKDNNDIYIVDGYAAKLEYPIKEESINYAASRFETVYQRYLKETGCKVYVSIIPDKNYFIAKEHGYPSMDYDEFIRKMTERMPYAKYIDITKNLELSDYYKTDTHWRQEKIQDVANDLAKEMGVTLTNDYEEVMVEEPFYGVYYGQSALPLKPDKLYYLNNKLLEEMTVYDYETKETIPIYNLELTKGNDPYEMFLSGSKSLLTIENPNATTKKELMIVRDSFGSSITPLLASGYSKITLIDIRYISPMLLDKFITFHNQDVLFLYSTLVLNNSVTIK